MQGFRHDKTRRTELNKKNDPMMDDCVAECRESPIGSSQSRDLKTNDANAFGYFAQAFS